MLAFLHWYFPLPNILSLSLEYWWKATIKTRFWKWDMLFQVLKENSKEMFKWDMPFQVLPSPIRTLWRERKTPRGDPTA
jgi:hypothetical protein